MVLFAGVASAATVLGTAYEIDPRTLGELAAPGCRCGRGLVVQSVGVNAAPTAETWWGLWLENGGLWIKAVEVRETRWDSLNESEPAECLHGVEGAPTWLLHGVPGLSAGPVNITPGGDDFPMWPGRRLTAQGGYVGKPEVAVATISAFGSAGGQAPRPRVSDYRLVYQDLRDSVDLAGPSAFDGDSTVSVAFMGDVDRDGYVDVLIDSGQPDDLNPTVLLLSSHAGPGQLLGAAAIQVHGTCC
jgi:hypothetical protein